MKPYRQRRKQLFPIPVTLWSLSLSDCESGYKGAQDGKRKSKPNIAEKIATEAVLLTVRNIDKHNHRWQEN